MNEIKSLADQVRSKMAKPDTPDAGKTEPVKKKAVKPAIVPPIVEMLREYDITGHKSMIHVRSDAQTTQMLHHFKMATGIEVTRLVAYSIEYLIKQYPEIKTIVKHYIENLEL